MKEDPEYRGLHHDGPNQAGFLHRQQESEPWPRPAPPRLEDVNRRLQNIERGVLVVLVLLFLAVVTGFVVLNGRLNEIAAEPLELEVR